MGCFGSELERALSGFVVERFLFVRDSLEDAELVVDLKAGQVQVELAIDGEQFVVAANDDLDHQILQLGSILREELEQVVCRESGFIAESFCKNLRLLCCKRFRIRKDRAVADD